MINQVRPGAPSSFLFLTFAVWSVCPSALLAHPATSPLDPDSVQPSVRIQHGIQDDHVLAVRGSVHPAAKPENEIGIVDPAYRMDHMVLALLPDSTQQAALDELVKEQQDPSSPNFHRWLTPAEFGRSFGVAQADINTIVAWLQSHGFSIDEVPIGHRSIAFSGTVQQVEEAFHTEMRTYRVHGEIHHANATPIQIPQALAPVVSGIVSLHDFLSSTRNISRISQSSPLDLSATGQNQVGPADFATIYNLLPLYQSGILGDGQTIAVAGRSNIYLSDVASFRSYFGLAANAPQVIVNGTDPGPSSTAGELEEATLDVEWAGAIAPHATVKFVVTATTSGIDGSYASAEYIVNNNVAPVLSMSFGACESALGGLGGTGNNYFNALWQQAAVQGITVLVASGDSGAAGCDASTETTATQGPAVNGICSTPFDTCVGGTEFDDGGGSYWSSSISATSKLSALSYIPEVAWNESATYDDLAASGGGASTIYPKPAWQTGTGVPADNQRDVPDVAVTAGLHDGYTIVVNGARSYLGGTSAATSAFASLMTLVVQKVGESQGNINPVLYQLPTVAPIMGRPIYNDITSGDNWVPGISLVEPLNAFSAGVGYDQVTGWGSVDGTAFAENWVSALGGSLFEIQCDCAQTGGISVAPGSTSAPVNLYVTASSGFSSTVALSISGLPSAATAVLGSPTLIGAGSSTLTIDTTSSVLPGTYAIVASATVGSVTHSVTIPLSIQNANLSANTQSLAVVQGGSATSLITVTPSLGFTSNVTFSITGASTGLTATFSPATVNGGSGTTTMTVSASATLKPGTYTFNVVGTNTTSVLAYSVVVTNPLTITAPTTASVPAGGTGTVTVSVAVPTPVVAGGFSQIVTLTITNPPAGITGSFDSQSPFPAPGSGSSVLTFTVAGTVKPGTYATTITATASNGVTATAAITVKVVTPFAVQTGATSVSLPQFGSGTVTVSLGSLVSGFVSPVTLTASSTVTGLTFTPDNVTDGVIPLPYTAIATLTISASGAVATGSYTVTITATSGNDVVETATIKAVVTAPFSVTVPAVTVPQGGSAADIVTVTDLPGFFAQGTPTNSVALTATVPTGITASYSQTSLSFPGCSPSTTAATCTSTLTLAVSSSLKPGTYQVTVTGTGNGVSVPVKITVTVVSPFTVVSSLTLVTLSQGGTSAPVTISLAGMTNGFTSPVALTLTSTTVGLTGTFDATSGGVINPPYTGSAILTMAASTTVKSGLYPVTITATGNGLAVSTTIQVLIGFAVNVSPTAVALSQNGTATATVSLGNVPNGLVSPVTLTASSPVAGLTFNLSPTVIDAPYSTVAKLTLYATTSVKPGTYTFTVTAAGGNLSVSSTIQVTVSGVQPFVINVPSSVSMPQFGSGSAILSVGSVVSGLVPPITLTVTGTTPAAAGLTFTWDASNGVINTPYTTSTATLTAAADGTVPPGSYTVAIKGTSANNLTANATLNVTVAAPFSVAAASPSVTVAEGGTTTDTITVTDTAAFLALGSPSNTVALSAAGPAGLPGFSASLSPSVANANGSTSVLTLGADQTVSPGSYTVTVTGIGNGVTISIKITAKVSAPFTVISSASAVQLTQADLTIGAPLTISLGSVVPGFVSPVTLAVSPVPGASGLIGTFDSVSNGVILSPYSSTATLTLFADITVQPTQAGAPYAVTITATSANGVVETATVYAQVTLPPFTVNLLGNVVVEPGSSATDTVTVTDKSGSSTIALAAITPPGITASFSKTAVSSSGSSTLTLTVDDSMGPGFYYVAVTGEDKGVTITSKVKVAVGASTTGRLGNKGSAKGFHRVTR